MLTQVHWKEEVIPSALLVVGPAAAAGFGEDAEGNAQQATRQPGHNQRRAHQPQCWRFETLQRRCSKRSYSRKT